MSTPPRLHVIEGSPAPDTPIECVRNRVRAQAKPPAMLSCSRCGGRELIESKIGVVRKNGKATGGTKVQLCVGCLLKGERMVVS